MSQIEETRMVKPFFCDIFYFWAKKMSQSIFNVTHFFEDMSHFNSGWFLILFILKTICGFSCRGCGADPYISFRSKNVHK